jgi:(p)ppGpp synthase/HD superfamily hydrolase
MTDHDPIAAAEALARRAHAGQLDKSGADYLEHPARVAGKLGEPQAVAVAWLHDVIEDTPVTEPEVRGEFGDEIADAVLAITHPEDEPNDEYYRRVRANPLALSVKTADIHDNLDPARLALLEPALRQRLILKYANALQALYVDDPAT